MAVVCARTSHPLDTAGYNVAATPQRLPSALQLLFISSMDLAHGATRSRAGYPELGALPGAADVSSTDTGAADELPNDWQIVGSPPADARHSFLPNAAGTSRSPTSQAARQAIRSHPAEALASRHPSETAAPSGTDALAPLFAGVALDLSLIHI